MGERNFESERDDNGQSFNIANNIANDGMQVRVEQIEFLRFLVIISVIPDFLPENQPVDPQGANALSNKANLWN